MTILTPQRSVASQILYDLYVGYTFPQSSGPTLLYGTKLRGGVRNVFNRAPPYSDGNITGYDAAEGDITGRSVFLELSKRF